MPRELKPQKVDQVEDSQTGYIVPIMLDRNSLTFFAEFNGEGTKAASAAEVRVWVEKAIKEARDFVWEGVIEVSKNTQHTSENAYIQYTINRFWHTKTINGNPLKCDWKYQTDLARSSNGHQWHFSPKEIPSHIPQRFTSDYDHYYLPYDEATWKGLEELLVALKTITEKIDVILGDDPDQLAVVGSRILGMLPAGEPEVERRWFKTKSHGEKVEPPIEENPPKEGIEWMDNGKLAVRHNWEGSRNFNASNDEWAYLPISS